MIAAMAVPGRPSSFGHSFGPMAVVPSLHYAAGRGKAHPLNFLAGYQGRFLQCDA